MPTLQPIRSRQKLGKYRIEKRLAQGGFADVFKAYDTIEGIRVALKVPQPGLITDALQDDLRAEVRLTARLDHPHILPIKNADTIAGHFVIAFLLGDGTLADRMRRRLSFAKALDFSEQILAGLAYAHTHRVLHCDVKPENFILFGDHVRLADFGISKVAAKTMQASGSGTIGFMAPEQAMGKPSLRSDVFAAGLVIYRMLAGTLPEWPFDWPPPGFDRLRRRVHPELIAVLRRSLMVDPKRRFANAGQMYEAVSALKRRALHYAATKSPARTKSGGKTKRALDWRTVQVKQFTRRYGKALATTHRCHKCERPVSEAMRACPWCGVKRTKLREETRFPASCPRCKRGLKLDWRFCPWCYGASVGPHSEREYTDKRYSARCPNTSCTRREIMPFMRYCPWCRTKIRRPWPIADKRGRCAACRWGVLSDYWTHCPWCTKSIGSGRNGR